MNKKKSRFRIWQFHNLKNVFFAYMCVLQYLALNEKKKMHQIWLGQIWCKGVQTRSVIRGKDGICQPHLPANVHFNRLIVCTSLRLFCSKQIWYKAIFTSLEREDNPLFVCFVFLFVCCSIVGFLFKWIAFKVYRNFESVLSRRFP